MKKPVSPEDIFPDGEDYTIVVNPFTGFQGKARKATVAATLNNIALLNRLLIEDEKVEDIQTTHEEISKLISSLKAIGVFDLFSLEEWLSDHRQVGRIYVAVLYLEHYRDEMTPDLILKLKEIKGSVESQALRSQIAKLI